MYKWANRIAQTSKRKKIWIFSVAQRVKDLTAVAWVAAEVWV